MTSLPMPASGPPLPTPSVPDREATPEFVSAAIPAIVEDGKFLLQAFCSFAEAAASLERSYGSLRAEVERLRRELEKTHTDLTASLEENSSMRAHLDRILESLPCGVLVIVGGELTRANPEARHLLGDHMKVGGPVGEAIAALPTAIRQMIGCADDSANPATFAGATGNTVEQELSLPAENGPARWLAARHAPIADMQAPSSVIILEDISERKRLETAQAELRREQALVEMSAVLAHEIRNPLASLDLFAGLLAESELDGERRHWIEQVQSGLRTLAATVHNVLHFHTLPEPERALLDLGQLLDWARDFFSPLARQAHITLSSQNRLVGVFLWADRHRLEQVLLNLVLNAMRAMPGGGWIEIGGHKSRDGQVAVLRVADTGPGIAAEHLPKIFEPGFSTRAQSPGLGLAVCRKIVEQHGGAIRTESSPGRGATFVLSFPLALVPNSNHPRRNFAGISSGDAR
jgi:two-component system, sensor histidine kinase FlrB